MATTLHLGDCQNDCIICANNYHDGQDICNICGEDFTSKTEWAIA